MSHSIEDRIMEIADKFSYDSETYQSLKEDLENLVNRAEEETIEAIISLKHESTCR